MPDVKTKPYSANSIINSVVAGYSAGICGTIVGHPFESIKVLLQTNNYQSIRSNSSCSNIKHDHGFRKMSTLSSFGSQSSKIGTKFGGRSLRALYTGISGPLLTVGATQAVMFSIYDTTRRCLYETSEHNDYLNGDPLANVFFAALLSGGIMSVVTGPLQVIKTKQQIMVWSFQRAVKDTRGLSRLFVGYRLHAFCSGLGRGIYMTTYETLKRFLAKQGHKDGKQITLTQRAICAASAGTLSWALMFPADVVRSRIYAQSISNKRNQIVKQQGILDVAKSIYRQGGNSIALFYRGFGVTVLRAGPVAAFVLPIYDITLEYLQNRQ